jgi:hypothetical protein
MDKIHGQNSWTKFMDKIHGQNSYGLLIRNIYELLHFESLSTEQIRKK